MLQNIRLAAFNAHRSFYLNQARTFTGKTESAFKYKTPKLKMRCVRPLYPAPGLDLKVPQELDPVTYCRQIGGDCEEYADKFEDINEVFNLSSQQMKEKGVPTVQRKYILRCRELLRRGRLTFEYLNRRTCLDRCRK